MAKSSRLLQLPGELRNKIYEYALTEERGLVAYANSPCVLRTFRRGPDRESNQLKYVCHQLYAETRDLALRYNRLTFCGPGPWGGLGTLYDYLFHCTSPSHLKGVTRVYIETWPAEGIAPRTHLHLLMGEIAIAYPSLEIAVRLPWLRDDVTPMDRKLTAIGVQKAIGGSVPASLCRAKALHVAVTCDRMAYHFPYARSVVGRNIRFDLKASTSRSSKH